MRRDTSIPILFRKTAEDLQVSTIFLKKEVAVKHCTKCKQDKPIASFYVESAAKAKNGNSTRNQCISCWDIYKGKQSQTLPNGNNLNDFL